LAALPAKRGQGHSPTDSAAEQAPRPTDWPAYAAPRTCGECHETQAYAHATSHHGQAMDLATEATVLGDFDDAVLEHGGTTTRFFRRGGRFLMEAQGPDGVLTEYEAAFTFGVDPLQQYLVPFPGGRLQALQVAWDTEQKRWFALQGDDPPPAGDAYHWTGAMQTANAMCIECHTTAYDKGYDPDTDAYATTWLETGVGCQACHGPGAGHLDWVAAGESEDDERAGFAQSLNDPGVEGSLRQVEQCVRCHARRRAVVDVPASEASFLDAYSPSLLRDGLYHADGQILDEVFVYGSFVQSRMHAAGVRCGDCHEPHGLTLRAEGNALCTQCHNADRVDPRFPTLVPGAYDTPEHHHHDQGTEGSACVDCHMPERTYMVVDPRRDHGFRVPRPDLSVALGVPEPCTGCHVDQDATWAAAQVTEWAAGRERESQIGQPHFATPFAAARRGDLDPGLAQTLRAWATDAEQPAIVRATAVGHLVDRGALDPALVGDMTRDEQPLVRAAAARTLDLLPPGLSLPLAGALSADPVGSVRSAAAHALGAVPLGEFPEEDREAVAAAVQEHLASELSQTDLPDGAFRLGLFAARAGRLEDAEVAYRRALAIDPLLLPARFNLVHLFDTQGRAADAEALLREGVAALPAEGELHYSLGLLMAQEQRLPEAITSLRRASQLLTGNSRAAYNLGLALLQAERPQEAELALQEAVARNPAEVDAWNGLIGIAMDRDDLATARACALQLRRVTPGPTPDLDHFIGELERNLAERAEG
jgi:predicted CXXCH cytochrome family protein